VAGPVRFEEGQNLLQIPDSRVSVASITPRRDLVAEGPFPFIGILIGLSVSQIKGLDE
jgi:hypothetical protein